MLMVPPSSLSSDSLVKGTKKREKKKKGSPAQLAPMERCAKPALHGVIKSLVLSVQMIARDYFCFVHLFKRAPGPAGQ